MTTQTIMQAAKTAQADVKLARKTLKAAAEGADLQAEICENIYPLLETLARIGQRCAEELEELGGVVAELVEEEESFITTEDANKISFALGAGHALAAELSKLLPTMADEFQKKRLEEAVVSYQKAAENAWRAVSEAAGDEGDDDDEEEGDEVEGDDEHEDLTEPPTAGAEEDSNG